MVFFVIKTCFYLALDRDREIQLSLKPIEEQEGEEVAADNAVSVNAPNQSQEKHETSIVPDASLPNTLAGMKEIMGDRLVISSVESSPPKVEKREVVKGVRM